MKIKFQTSYYVGYLPTPRCRKLRYKEEKEYLYGEVLEVPFKNLNLAFETFGYDAKKIYLYNEKLWTKATENDIHYGDSDNPMTALEALVYSGITYSTYYARRLYDHKGCNIGKETRDDVMKRINKDMSNYIISNGELYQVCSEPMYCIYTFGLGYNHGGIGTFLNIVDYYNSNISKEVYFNALEYDKAQKEALEIAENRGDTNSLYYIKNMKPIKVYDKKFVHRNPKKDNIY